MKRPVVSVIIPYSNRPEYLDMVLTAYEKQSHGTIEFLVVYDELCSINDLQNVTRGRNVKLLGFSPGQGYGRMGLSRNIGAANAQGDVLIFNDVDVIPDRAAVERIAKAHSENHGLVVCGRVRRIEHGLEAVRRIDICNREELERISTIYEYGHSIQWSTRDAVRKSEIWWAFISGFCSFSRHDFLLLTGYDPEYVGWGYEDTDLGYRILRHGLSLAFFSDIIGYHIDHPQEEWKVFEALRNMDRLIRKYPELKSSPVLVKRRRELTEEAREKKNAGQGTPLAMHSRLLARPGIWARLIRDKDVPIGTIAVVIPAGNRAHYLKEAVLSVIHQTRPAQEIHIVVDPSEDNTEAVADELSRSIPVVRCIKNSETRGVAECRNQGLVASASDYVMFLDSDDVLKPSYFDKVASVLDRNLKVGVAYSDYAEFGDRTRLVSLPDFDERLLLVDCIVMGPAMARRRALEQSGGYKPTQVFEDWELWIRVVEQGWAAKGVHEALYNYRVHKGNRDSESNKIRKEGEDLIYQEHTNFYKRHGITRTPEGKWVGAPASTPYR